jgi:hypothetical protein
VRLILQALRLHNALDRLTQPPRDGEVQPDTIRRLVELGLKAKPKG